MVSTPSANDFIPRAAAQFDNGLHHGHLRIVRVGDQHAIDLENVDWKSLERGEGRIAGAEIVECDGNPELTQLVEIPDRAIVHNTCLGDFELQQLRRQAESVSAFFTIAPNSRDTNCTGETLTETPIPVGHPAAAAVAIAIACAPRGMIIPVSSATEMNWLGPMRPRLGWFHRRRASKATTSPV